MIEVKECSKAFDTVKAVNKATLDVGVREVFGLVGSNGAGKSTLLRMMAGIIKPDEGEIQIDGMPVYETPLLCQTYILFLIMLISSINLNLKTTIL